MKKILLIILIFSYPSFGNVNWDKVDKQYHKNNSDQLYNHLKYCQNSIQYEGLFTKHSFSYEEKLIICCGMLRGYLDDIVNYNKSVEKEKLTRALNHYSYNKDKKKCHKDNQYCKIDGFYCPVEK
jgi:hypothetical protein